MIARSVMDTARSRIMREPEIMWTQYAPDAMVSELVRPAVVAENDREYIAHKEKVTSRLVRYLFLVHHIYVWDNYLLGNVFFCNRLLGNS